jgi:hypothetical protein
MSWLNKFFSFFKRREKVSLAESNLMNLQIISPFQFSDQELLPGMSRDISYGTTVGTRGLSYFNSAYGTSTTENVPPQYDHIEIEILYDVESYFARATRAKSALFIKEGYEFIGNNDTTVEYVRERIRQIQRASKYSFRILLTEIFRDLVVHSNAYVLKVRKTSASGGQVRTSGKKKLQPVAGYFRLAPETMVPVIDPNGNIVSWKQDIGGQERYFSVDDIQHFYCNRKAGYPLGIPDIIPAIDDIRALRSLEHNIDVLIHKHLFPIVLWKVGTENRPAQYHSDGTSEIDVVTEKVANMPTEGSLVVSERYDVKAIGIESKALRVESYLTHYRDRLLAGLDVSSIDIGIGNSSSRSTAQTLSRNLVDTVKLKQIIIQEFVGPMIDELLLESTFDSDTVLDEENLVRLRFHEIDKEAQHANGNYLIDSFNKQAITYPELRLGLGREVLTEEEEEELHWNKFGKKQALIASVDELSGEGATTPEDASIGNKNNPQNQHGRRGSSKLNHDFIDSENQSKNPILDWHKVLASSLQTSWAKGSLKTAQVQMEVMFAYNQAIDEFKSELHPIMRNNYRDPATIAGIIKVCDVSLEKSIARLRNNILFRLKDLSRAPDITFSSLEYRTTLIYKTEKSFSDNYSKYKWLVKNKVDMKVISKGQTCPECLPKLTTIKWDDKLGEVKIPPFHPQCHCIVTEI